MNKLHEFRKEVSSSYFPISKTRDYVAYTHLLLILKTLKVTLITQLLKKKKKIDTHRQKLINLLIRLWSIFIRFISLKRNEKF